MLDTIPVKKLLGAAGFMISKETDGRGTYARDELVGFVASLGYKGLLR